MRLPCLDSFRPCPCLRRRSLVERGQRQGSFTLQSVVLEYVIAWLIAEATSEIQQDRLDRLIQHGLEQAHAREYIRQTQERLLLSPILARLQSASQGQADVEGRLLWLLDRLRGRDQTSQGYGPANLVGLLRVLQCHGPLQCSVAGHCESFVHVVVVVVEHTKPAAPATPVVAGSKPLGTPACSPGFG